MSVQRMVLGNWKMNTTRDQAISLGAFLRDLVKPDGVIVGVSPPFPWIYPVREILQNSDIRLGAQTCAATTNGAFTGEVSASMLAEICEFVLVGHSERRTLLGETDQIVREKVARILDENLIPIICVGETLEQRQSGNAETVVRRQLRAALEAVHGPQVPQLVIAYEPVWAIGTGHNASPEDASAMCASISRTLAEHGLVDVPVLYGGSVSAANAASLIAAGDIDGFLVGGASLKPDDFAAIVQSAGN